MITDSSDFIRNIISKSVVSVNENDSIEEMLTLLGEHRFHRYPVVTDGSELLGVIDQDIILEILMFHQIPLCKYAHLTAAQVLGKTAKEAMTSHPATISPDASLWDAAVLMMKSAWSKMESWQELFPNLI